MMRNAGLAIDHEEKMRRRHLVAAAVVLVEQVAAVGKAAEAKTKIEKMKILLIK